jgi:hypothetical protein
MLVPRCHNGTSSDRRLLVRDPFRLFRLNWKSVKLQYLNNMPSKIKVDRGSSDFIWQRATSISVGWFASRNLKNNNK